MAGGRFTAEQVTQNLAKSQATRPQAGGLKVVSARRSAKVPRERFATVNEVWTWRCGACRAWT